MVNCKTASFWVGVGGNYGVYNVKYLIIAV